MDVPNGNIILAAFQAMSAGITAVALVLMYRTSRIINFAQIALGALAAQLFYHFYATEKLMPYGLALVVAALGGVLIAVIIGMIASFLFFRHPRLVMTVVTIFFVGLIGYVQGQVQRIFIKPGEVTRPETIIGPLPNTRWEVDTIPFRIAHLVGFLLMVLVLVALVVFFRKTRTGIAIRASAENADRAALLGINVKLLNVGVWALVGFMASIAQLGILPVQQYNLNEILDQTGLLLPLAAAVVARMASMPVAFFTAFGVVMLERGVNLWTGDSSLVRVGVVGMLMLGLLLQRKKLSTRAEEGTSWKAMKEFRPIPRELLALPGVRRARYALLGVFAFIVLLMPWIVGLTTVNTLQAIWLAAITGVSLVILTGWSGQISLGQFAIVSVGAFVAGNLSLHQHWPFLINLLVGGLVGAVMALLIGLPALRIRGLFLAASTFAIAIITPLFLFDPKYLGDSVPLSDVPRPKLFFLDFSDERSMYYLLLLFFVGTVAFMMALRKSRAGRVLIAIRDNEDGARAFGVNVVRTRLIAFALSGFMAGFGGALTIFQQLGMSQQLFNANLSIQIFILVVIGGVSSAMGAFLGALYFIGAGILFPGVQALIQGVLGLMVLMFIPGGLTQVIYGVRDGVLRVIAMRRNIVVPSLFSDYSPEAWEKRLAPLSPPVQSHGLAALRHDQRYRLPSRIFGRAQA
jgi:branched-chain amino acid transport system permease protein